MNLKQFSDEHNGLSVAIRRHLESRKVEAVKALLTPAVALALRLSRHLDDDQQGLSFEGEKHAFEQGELFANIDLVPVVIVCGTDQRNLDGGLATAEGIAKVSKHKVPVVRSPGITYPYYGDPKVAADILGRWDHQAPHRHYSGQFTTRGLWTESVAAVEARLMGAVAAVCAGSEFGSGFELWDANFEQMILWDQLLVKERPLTEIAYEPGEAHDPPYGAGIAIAVDGTIARFRQDLTIE